MLSFIESLLHHQPSLVDQSQSPCKVNTENSLREWRKNVCNLIIPSARNLHQHIRVVEASLEALSCAALRDSKRDGGRAGQVINVNICKNDSNFCPASCAPQMLDKKELLTSHNDLEGIQLFQLNWGPTKQEIVNQRNLASSSRYHR